MSSSPRGFRETEETANGGVNADEGHSAPMWRSSALLRRRETSV